jgi:hypothetical protein
MNNLDDVKNEFYQLLGDVNLLNSFELNLSTIKSKIKSVGKIISIAREFSKTGIMKNDYGIESFTSPVNEIIQTCLEDLTMYGVEFQKGLFDIDKLRQKYLENSNK